MEDEKRGFGIAPVWLRGRLTANEIAVYVALSWRVNDEGNCWPSHKTLAADAGMSERTAQRALDSLVAKRIVAKTQRRAEDGGLTSNMYHLRVWRQ